jgi:pimeloyl-ACP methyl ester carboxylesterase
MIGVSRVGRLFLWMLPLAVPLPGHAQSVSHPAPLVIFVGGAGDSFMALVRTAADAYQEEHPDHQVEYFDVDEGPRLLSRLRDHRRQPDASPIVLIGHSWGGDTSYEVARQITEAGSIDLWITLDAVSRFTSAPADKPASVVSWINVFANYRARPRAADCTWLGDFLGTAGGRWLRRPGAVNVRAGTCHVDLEGMMNAEEVQAALRALERESVP